MGRNNYSEVIISVEKPVERIIPVAAYPLY
jgi:hypothetical protein